MPHGHRVQNPFANKLWIARKRAGYLQKWVASLLGQRSVSMVSEYEKGRKLPSLRTALKLEHIYQTPLPELFPSLYAEIVEEVEKAKQCHSPLRRRDEEVQRELALRAEVSAARQTESVSPALIRSRV